MVHSKRGGPEPTSMNLWIVINIIKIFTVHRLNVLLNTMCAIKSHLKLHMTQCSRPYYWSPFDKWGKGDTQGSHNVSKVIQKQAGLDAPGPSPWGYCEWPRKMQALCSQPTFGSELHAVSHPREWGSEVSFCPCFMVFVPVASSEPPVPPTEMHTLKNINMYYCIIRKRNQQLFLKRI